MQRRFTDIHDYDHITSELITQDEQGAVYRTQNTDIALRLFTDAGGAVSRDLARNERCEEQYLLPIPQGVDLALPQASLLDCAGYVMTLPESMQPLTQAFDYVSAAERTLREASGEEDETVGTDPQETVTERQTGLTDDASDDILAQYLASGGRRRRLAAYHRIAAMLSLLHGAGLVYGSLSEKNVFLSGSADSLRVRLIGAESIGYCDEAARTVGFDEDADAFAAMLYRQLTGKQSSEDKDGGMRADCIISDGLAGLFERTFSAEGKARPESRPTMFEWMYRLARELDESVQCSRCKMDYDAARACCPWCGHAERTLRLRAVRSGREVWRVMREAQSGAKYRVTSRLLQGCRAEEGAPAFTAACGEDTLVLSGMQSGRSWSLSVDGGETFRDIYGSVTLPYKAIIETVKHDTGERIRIEVDRI